MELADELAAQLKKVGDSLKAIGEEALAAVERHEQSKQTPAPTPPPAPEK